MVLEQVYMGMVFFVDGCVWVQMVIVFDGGVFDLVLNVIDLVKILICIVVYLFISKFIVEVFLCKQKVGVLVMVVMDKFQFMECYMFVIFLVNVGIFVCINFRYVIQYLKVLVVDGDIVEMGSFNYMDFVVKCNSENVLVIWYYLMLVKEYMIYWQWFWEEGEFYRVWY